MTAATTPTNRATTPLAGRITAALDVLFITKPERPSAVSTVTV